MDTQNPNQNPRLLDRLRDRMYDDPLLPVDLLACAALVVAFALVLSGCDASAGGSRLAQSANQASEQVTLEEVAEVVEAAPADPIALYSSGAVFTANEATGTRIYTPYYSVVIPYGFWPEGFGYEYEDAVDETGLGHMLTVTHPDAGTDAVLVYCYDASAQGFVAPQGEYVALDLGLSRADSSQGVAVAEGYAKVGYDSAQADAAVFAANVAGIDWW